MKSMVMLRENNHMTKKRSLGRKKIEIKKIENTNSRQVTFSKRRVGLFKKASELCILSGAEIAIVVHSLGKRVFSFGHPNADAVIERFLGNGEVDVAARGGQAHAADARDYNRHYSDVCRELEAERKRNEVMEVASGRWWDEAVDGMELDELQQYLAALEELANKVTERADALMLLRRSCTMPSPSTLGMEAAAAYSASDETASFMNQGQLIDQNQMGGGFDYENFIIPNGFGQGQLQL
ncbi:hypothetical protein OROGR_004305 [Orobanche gracilis]